MVVVIVVGIISAIIYGSTTSINDRAIFTRAQLFSQKLNNSLADSIAGEWTLYEGVGSSVSDSSGNGNTGTITGATWETTKTNCVSDNCLYFDGGLGDYVQLSAISFLTTGKSFVISSWVYPETTGNYRTIVGYNGTHRLLINDNGQMLSQQDNNFTSNAAGDVPDGRWTHVVYWYNGTTGTYGQERWFINGVQSGASRDLPSQAAEWDQAFKVGQYDLANYPYKGRIDDVVFFDNYLSLVHINELYFGGLYRLLTRGQIDAREYQERITDLKIHLTQNELR